MNIYQKLLKIEESVKGLGKDKAANTYKYVTGDKVLGEIKPLMIKHGLLLKQEILSIENTRQDYVVGFAEKQRTKSEILSKVMMRFTWVDTETGEKDENLFGANGQNDWDKGIGSALTYGERYFLLKYFHIPTDEDDIDNPDRKPDANEQASPLPPPVLAVDDELKSRIGRAKDSKDLTAIWNTNKPLQPLKEFVDLLAKRRDEVTQQLELTESK